MTGHGAKFGRKMEAAILALLTRPSIEDAARVAGIAEKTLRRWMRDPEFKAEYLRARREAASQAIALIQQGMGGAAITMRKLMTDVNVPAAVRLRAAEAVVGLGIKGIEVEDIEARLSQLEAAAEENKKGGKGR
jgi:hypothetical protein